MEKHQPRADEPIYWLLFGAGGMVLGIFVPAIILLLIFAGMGSPDLNNGLLSYQHVAGMLGNWFFSLVIFGSVALIFWHTLHRIYHSLHDFTIRVTKLHWFLLYGGAAALTFMLLAFHLVAYVKLF